MTSPTEQWIRGRERRTPKAPRVLVVKRSVVEPGLRPHRDAQHHLAVDWLRTEGLVGPSAATDFIDAHPAPSVP